MSNLKLESLAISILVYLVIVVAILFFLVYSPSFKESKNFVEKKGEIIEVSLGSIPSSIRSSNSKKKRSIKAKKKKKIVKKPKKRVNKIRNIKSKKDIKNKKIIKSKKSKKSIKKESNVKSSKISSKNLFKSINTKEFIKEGSNKKIISNSFKQGAGGKSLKKLNQGKGEENKYLGKISRILRGWPAQSNFAGEKIRVKLVIYSSGLFDYKILYKSLNPEFNEALRNYLEQLKRSGGFGPHSNPEPYNIEVEFIAK